MEVAEKEEKVKEKTNNHLPAKAKEKGMGKQSTTVSGFTTLPDVKSPRVSARTSTTRELRAKRNLTWW